MATSAVQLLVGNPSMVFKWKKIQNGNMAACKVSPGRRNRKYLSVKCSGTAPMVERRSANYYTSCVWDYDYIESYTQNKFLDEDFKMRIDEMKQQVLVMLSCVSDWEEQIELIDDLQRLGVAYHFKKEIKTILDRIYYSNYAFEDLHTTAVGFRIFRQHGYAVPQGVFRRFMDDSGKFKSSICSDIKGLISLYEASYLATEDEAIMEEAWSFTTSNLSKVNKTDEYLNVLSSRALNMPLHWRTDRCEARWFIDTAYDKKPNMSPLLLQFAKMDFNRVQAIYLEELRELARWWKNLRFDEDLGFARDCLVVSYIWGLMADPDPQYASCRKAFAQIIALVSIVDDVYDIYGTLEELELFTDAFKRWDIDAMKQLPHYMKKCYLACYNGVNQMTYDTLKDKGIDVSPYLKKAWEILSNAYMKEARWYHIGFKPTTNEYITNAWLSVAIPLCFTHGHIFDPNPLNENQLIYLETLPEILKWACIIFRLCDDLGTSPDEMTRGDTLKAIQCHMNETGATEEEARVHVKSLIREGWKKLNKLVMEERILKEGGTVRLLNLVRASHAFYQYGDGHGVQDTESSKYLMSQVLFDPITL